MTVNRTSVSPNLTQAKGPKDSRDAVNSEMMLVFVLVYRMGRGTCESKNILNLRLEPHLDKLIREFDTSSSIHRPINDILERNDYENDGVGDVVVMFSHKRRCPSTRLNSMSPPRSLRLNFNLTTTNTNTTEELKKIAKRCCENVYV
jgi:hypothetical protein